MNYANEAALLIDWAKDQGISIRIEYWESDNTMSVETISASPIECYYEKRITAANDFIQHWNERLEDFK